MTTLQKSAVMAAASNFSELPNAMHYLSFLLLPVGILGLTITVRADFPGQDTRSALLIKKVGASTLDSSIGSSQPAVEIRAIKDASKAFIRAGRTVSEVSDDISSFSTADVTISAPINKNDSTTNLATLDGLANAFTLEFKLTKFVVPRNPIRPGFTAAQLQRYRDALDKGAKAQGAQPPPEVSIGAMDRFAPDLAGEYLSHFWNEEKPQYAIGISGAIGYQEYKFIDAVTLGDGSTKKTPYSLKAFFGKLIPSSGRLLGVGAEYQSAFKNSDSKSVLIAPPASGPQEVKTGAFGPPKSDDKHLVYVEYRQLIDVGLKEKIGISVKGTYDARSKKVGVDIPILMARDDKGGLTGGVLLSWNEMNDTFTAGIIVGGSFSLYQ